jgi:hypothetical protein
MLAANALIQQKSAVNKPREDEPDHIYIDGNLYNNTYLTPTGPVQYVPAEIKQTRDSPIIYNPGQYNLTIARFSISSDDVPRVFQDARTTATGTYGTKWWVGVSYNGAFYDEPVILPTITDPLQNQVKYAYNIQQFVDVINDAWSDAQTAAQGAGAPTGPGDILMTYDNVSGLYTINVPSWYGSGTGGTTGSGIGVHMSFLLYQKFQSYNVIQNSPLQYNNHDITFVREWVGNNLTTDITLHVGTGGTGITGTYMQLKQDKAWPSSIMDVHRLYITTSSLPIYSEYISVLDSLQNGGGNGNQTLPILTDFLIGHDEDLNSRGENYIYTPTLYRLTSLKGTAPITQWDIKIYIGLADGTIYPLYIPPSGEMSVKLLFLKKGLSN